MWPLRSLTVTGRERGKLLSLSCLRFGNAIKSLVKNALSAVASTISGAASSIRSAIESAFNSAISFITSLRVRRLKWGQ